MGQAKGLGGGTRGEGNLTGVIVARLFLNAGEVVTLSSSIGFFFFGVFTGFEGFICRFGLRRRKADKRPKKIGYRIVVLLEKFRVLFRQWGKFPVIANR